MKNELLKNYSDEEKKELINKIKDTDASERVANQEKTEELLKNSTDPSAEANTLLLEETELERKANQLVFNDDYNEALETYVERGTAEDIFYKTLIKEANIKALYEENLDMLDGDGDNIIIPEEKDKKLVMKLLKNPVINFLIRSFPDREFEGKMLEEDQLMPENTTQRVLIKLYEGHIKRCDNAIKNLYPRENQKKYINERVGWQKKLEAINKNNSFSAISDEELEEMMKKIIQYQLKNK